jgi:hypothetical protein
VLAENLPWAQHLGTPDPHHQHPLTALARAATHLHALPTIPEDDAHRAATDLLAHRDRLTTTYRDLTRDLGAPTEHDHTRHRDRTNDTGLDL